MRAGVCATSAEERTDPTEKNHAVKCEPPSIEDSHLVMESLTSFYVGLHAVVFHPGAFREWREEEVRNVESVNQ